jgi:hypothetical protein
MRFMVLAIVGFVAVVVLADQAFTRGHYTEVVLRFLGMS